MQHYLFLENFDLCSISTVVLVGGQINYHKFWKSNIKIIVVDIRTMKFKQTDRVKSLDAMTSVIQLDNELFPINLKIC